MADSTASWIERNDFLLKRLHSLSGIIPVGVFVIFHLLTNSTAFLGAESYDEHVRSIHALPWLLAIEIIFIFVPLAYHGIYGFFLAIKARPNQNQYPYMDNWRYTLQRITAYIAIPFIVFHLLHYRFADWFGIAPSFKEAAKSLGGPGFYTFTQMGFQDHLFGLPPWLMLTIYAIGTGAVIYHFCNGMVTFCITWGITVGDVARKKVAAWSAVVGCLLVAWSVLALVALAGRPIHVEKDSTATEAAHVTPAGSVVADRGPGVMP